MAILALTAVVADTVAYHKMQLLTFVDAATYYQMAMIAFIHPHWWLALPYFAGILTRIFWLEVRGAPRRSVWLTLILLLTPCLMYTWACLSIDSRVVIFVPAAP